MKKLLKILLFSAFFVFLFGVSAYAVSVPEEIKERGSQYYIEPYVFERDNAFVLYLDGETLHGEFDHSINRNYQFSIWSEEDGWFHGNTELASNPHDTEDLSDNPGDYFRVRVFINNTDNPVEDGYRMVEYPVYRDNTGLHFKYSTSQAKYEQHMEYYNCITEDDYIYYIQSGAPNEGTEGYALCKPLVDQLIQGKTTAYDKARAIYTWVCENIYYDWPAYRGGNTDDAADLVTVMTTRKGVCSGYASVVSAMMNLADIPTLYIVGDSGGEGHAWNIINIDGTWCSVDATWDSGCKYGYTDNDNPEYEYSPSVSMYFGSTASMIGSDHNIGNAMGSIIINSVVYSMPYYVTQGYREAHVTGILKTDIETVRIRASIADLPVSVVDEETFVSYPQIKNIYIPKTVKHIYPGAFQLMTDLNVYIQGKDTQYKYMATDCTNLTVYAPFSSPNFEGENAYNFRVVNSDYVLESASVSGNTLTVNLYNGLYKNQPQILLAIYDNEGILCHMASQPTYANTDTYTFDITDYRISYTAKIFLMDGFGTLSPYCSHITRRLANIVTTDAMLESFHRYMNNEDETQSYTYDGTCHSIDVTFNSQTALAEGDIIYIYDQGDNLFGTYTGTQLAGETISVPGNSVKIRLVSDGTKTAYGYKTTAITVVKD